MTLYIIRGASGSGKSTYAGTLVAADAVFEADQFFMRDGRYEWDGTRLKDAHADCLLRTRAAMESGRHSAVAVANTFTKRWEMQPYIDLAEDMGWEVVVYRTTSRYPNLHGVPDEAVQRMRDRMESVDGETLV
jgi:predicted kinase